MVLLIMLVGLASNFGSKRLRFLIKDPINPPTLAMLYIRTSRLGGGKESKGCLSHRVLYKVNITPRGLVDCFSTDGPGIALAPEPFHRRKSTRFLLHDDTGFVDEWLSFWSAHEQILMFIEPVIATPLPLSEVSLAMFLAFGSFFRRVPIPLSGVSSSGCRSLFLPLSGCQSLSACSEASSPSAAGGLPGRADEREATSYACPSGWAAQAFCLCFFCLQGGTGATDASADGFNFGVVALGSLTRDGQSLPQCRQQSHGMSLLSQARLVMPSYLFSNAL